MISFKELIELEPKPKKVKYNGYVYDYKEKEYYCDECGVGYIYHCIEFYRLNEQNIEIIEEGDPILKHYDLADNPEIMSREQIGYNFMKINEELENIVDKVNELEKRNK